MIDIAVHAVCSRGWTVRCAAAKGRTCRCQCSGKNHGNQEAQQLKRTKHDGTFPAAPFAEAVPHAAYFGHYDRTTRTWYAYHGNGTPLDPRLDLRCHAPTGFAWGYAGSGPAQLSLALCADFLGNDVAALAVYQPFKFAVVAQLAQERDWVITEEQMHVTLRAVAHSGSVA